MFRQRQFESSGSSGGPAVGQYRVACFMPGRQQLGAFLMLLDQRPNVSQPDLTDMRREPIAQYAAEIVDGFTDLA